MRGDYFLKNIETHSLSKVQQHYIKFFRIYIPKSEDKVRPLGVPTRSWRIFLKMWLIPIMGFTGDKIPSGFHGYIPGRGTASAWQRILNTVIHKQNIYEVDFKQFFPSIPTDCLLYFMVQDLGFANDTANYFYQMNNSLPVFVMGQNGPEVTYTKAHQKSLLLEATKLNKPIKDLSSTGLREPGELIPENFSLGRPYSINRPTLIKGTPLLSPKVLDLEFTRRDLPFVKTEDLRFRLQLLKASKGIPLNRRLSAQEESALLAQLGHSDVVFKAVQQWFYLESKGGVGLPQGGGLSPYLSILYLEMVLEKLRIPEGVEYLFYADDGIFFSDSYSDLKAWLDQAFGHGEDSFFNWGINVHPEKSGWVKCQGTWLKALKFLGIYYVPGRTLGEAKLVACTRSGKSNLEFDKYELLKASFSNDLLYGLSEMTLKNRLTILRSFKQTPVTSAIVGYYETLQSLQRMLTRPEQRFVYEYLYLLSNLLSRGITLFALFFFTRANYLDNKVALEHFLDLQSIKTNQVDLKGFTTSEQSIIENVLAYLKSGYERNATGELEASNKLLSLLAKEPIGSPSLGLNPTDGPVEEAARRLLDASYTFLNKAGLITYLAKAPIFLGKLGTLFLKVPRILSLNVFFESILVTLFWWIHTPRAFLLQSDLYSKAQHVHRYFMRHWAKNLSTSRYYGLLFSRLYIGSWRSSSVDQDFQFSFKLHSLADHLHSKQQFTGQINIFVGSSYAHYEMVKWLSHSKRTSRINSRYRLFEEGFIPRGSWQSVSIVNAD
jgi:hypothetical protein